MADGSIIFSTALDNAQLEKDLARQRKEIEKNEKLIAETQSKREEAAKTSVFKAAELDAEKAKLQEIKDRLQDIRALSKDKSVSADSRAAYAGQIPGVQAELADQQTRVRLLQAEYNKIDNSVLRYDEKLKNANATLSEQKARAGELAQQISKAGGASDKMGKAISKAGKRMDKFINRVKRLASRVFVFTMITSALRSLRTWLGNVIKSSSEATAAIAKLKGALLTLAQPLINVFIPTLTKFLNLLAKITAVAANIVSKLFGTTASASAEAAKSLYNETNAIEDAGEAAEDAAGSLASFDEINQLSGESASSASAGDSDTIAPDFSGVIDEQLGLVEAVVGGALLALGAILAFSGVNIPLGITLMALGALTLTAAIKDNWDSIVQALQGPIGAVTALLGTALLVIGAILTFSGGNTALGIGLLIVGAAGLATTVAVNWNTISQTLQGPLGVLTGILSVAFLVIGSILTFSGANLPLGIGLMIAGAAGLAAACKVDWGAMQALLQGTIGAVTTIVSTALLALGAILAFTGAALPLGIGLMVVGAAGLAASIAANWNIIPELLQGPVGLVTGIISAALLVLGVILLFTGAGIPLGLGLIAAGAVGLVATIVPNWDFILEAVKGAWSNLKNWWNTNAAKYFTMDYWKQLGKDMLNGLIASVESGLNTALSGAGTFVNKIIGALNKIPGVEVDSISWGSIKLPRLAAGAVIPPNREFMAVLGDQKSGYNIEAPEDLIRKIVREESGGGNMAMLAMLREILNAIQEGKVLTVGRETFAKLVYDANQSEGNRVGVRL